MNSSPPSSALSSARPLLRRTGWRLLLLSMSVAILLAVLRYAAPWLVQHYQPELLARAGQALGVALRAEQLTLRWQGWRPELSLRQLRVTDRTGAESLSLQRVDATLSAGSWWRGELHFSRLEIFGAQLGLFRDRQGQIGLVGFGGGDSNPDAEGLDWLLAQGPIKFSETVLHWDDRWRGAPPLRLTGLALTLEPVRGGHHLQVAGELPAELGRAFELQVWLGERAGTGLGNRRGVGAELADRGGSTAFTWQGWRGELQLALEEVVLSAWQSWFDLPGAPAGVFSARLSAQRDAAEWRGEARFDWREGRLRPLAGGEEQGFLDFSGELSFVGDERVLQLSAQNLRLLDLAGRSLLVGSVAELSFEPRQALQVGRLRIERFELDQLASLAALLGVDEPWQARLGAQAPQGRLEKLELAWQGLAETAPQWQAEAQLSDFGLTAYQHWPGLSGLNGEGRANQGGGEFRLDSTAFALDLPQLFSAGPLALEGLEVAGRWQAVAAGWDIELLEATLDNADLAGRVAGQYQLRREGSDAIDLRAALSRARGEAVWRYLPRVAGAETQQWLRDALQAATVTSASLRLRGELEDFPFREQEGEFHVAVALEDGVLAYAPDWPAIEGIRAQLDFSGPGLSIQADRGRIFGAELSRVKVELPELDVHVSDLMTITGRAQGATADFLRFLAASPVSASIGGLTDQIEAQGKGALALQLRMPLLELENSKVTGTYRFSKNRLHVAAGLPVLDKVTGELNFTERGIDIPQARADFLGGETQLKAHSKAEGGLHFELAGVAELAALEAWQASFDGADGAGREGTLLSAQLFSRLAGNIDWSAELELDERYWQLALRSDLRTLHSSLPAPLGKERGQAWPLRFDLGSSLAPAGVVGAAADARQQFAFELTLDEGLVASARFEQTSAQGLRGALALGERLSLPALPAAGLTLKLALEELDADAWQTVLADARPAASSAGGGLPLRGELKFDRLQGLGRNWPAVQVSFSVSDNGWQADIDSDRVAGRLDWLDTGSGALRARLGKLLLGDADGTSKGGATGGGAAAPPATAAEEVELQRLPALDVVAERFVLHGLELGRLALNARNRSGLWLLDEVSLSNDEASLEGRGRWRTTGASHFELDFRLGVDSIGRLSRRLGLEDVIRGGKAQINGELNWRGGPTKLDYPSLNGQFRLNAAAGQFNRLEPGVGRLLGILSLQALPRRITLDFRDVFSAGFAFDRISGSMALDKGVMRSDDFIIHGPAARVSLQGWTDLQAETQLLRVRVQPTLTESIAIGAAASLVNPVAGVLTYLAQKALSDPIEQLFAYEYEISGSWSDPVVERIGKAALEQPFVEP